MKASILKSAVFIFTLVISVCNLTAKANDDNAEFFYSNGGAKDKESSQIVLKKDSKKNTLVPHVKYDFTYDEENRLVKKETFMWSSERNKWICKFHMRYTYTEDMVIAEYATWNSDKENIIHIRKK